MEGRCRRWLALAALLCVTVTFIAGSAADVALAADPVALTLYDQALALRQRGDFPGAIDKLEAAQRLDPNNPEILLLLGTVYGFVQRYDDAQRVLERARRLAPKDGDIVLALARIKAYRHDFAGAERDVRSVRAAQPNNLEALALAGRIAYYQGNLDSAEREFRAVLQISPDDLEGLLGLGDVEAARGDQAAALALYRKAEALAPDSQDVKERVSRAEQQQPRRFRFDSLFSWSHFPTSTMQPWYESFNQLTYSIAAGTDLHGLADVNERFHIFNTYIETGVDHRFDEAVAGYLYAGGTPDADYLAIWDVLAGGTVRLWKGGETLGATLLTIDAKDAFYNTGFVRSANPGAQQYLFSGRIWLTAKWINTWVADGQYLSGYFTRVDGLVTDAWHLYAGYARAPETENNITVQTRSAFGGIAWDVTRDLTLHLDYLWEDREHSYIRDAATVGVSVKF